MSNVVECDCKRNESEVPGVETDGDGRRRQSSRAAARTATQYMTQKQPRGDSAKGANVQWMSKEYTIGDVSVRNIVQNCPEILVRLVDQSLKQNVAQEHYRVPWRSKFLMLLLTNGIVA